MNALKTFTAIALTIGALDVGWLTFRNNYHQRLFQRVQGGPIQPRLLPSLLIYILIPAAVYVGAVLQGKTLQDTVFRAAVIGFFLYAFYDLTNYATLTGWTAEMTMIDILWGITVCSAGAAAGYYFRL